MSNSYSWKNSIGRIEDSNAPMERRLNRSNLPPCKSHRTKDTRQDACQT